MTSKSVSFECFFLFIINITERDDDDDDDDDDDEDDCLKVI